MEGMPTVFLVVSIIGALFTLNAFRPRYHRTLFVVPSFFAGWLTGELPLHHLVWQLAATVGFVLAGALDGWQGWAALGVSVASWSGLVLLATRARRTEAIVAMALDSGLRGELDDVSRDARAETPAPERMPHRALVIALPIAVRGVEVVRDVEYAEGAGRRHRLDVYRPRTPVTGAPVLLQIHGGGWVIGNKRQQALPLMYHLARKGWVCVAANYRLSPRATFPDHLVDVKLALRWIREHIEEHGGDPTFVAVTGGSAGGHLAAMVALTAGDPEYQPGFEDVDTSVRACVPFYGVYDLSGTFTGRGPDTLTRFVERVVLKRRLADDPAAFERARRPSGGCAPTHLRSWSSTGRTTPSCRCRRRARSWRRCGPCRAGPSCTSSCRVRSTRSRSCTRSAPSTSSAAAARFLASVHTGYLAGPAAPASGAGNPAGS